MTEHHTNPVFIPDEACTAPSTTEETTDNGKLPNETFTLELKDTDNNNYEPYEHRKVQHPTSNSDTLFHLLKGCLGTGILAMPKAFDHSGYVVGAIGTIIIGAICTYCVHMLIYCEYELCKRRKTGCLSYPAIAEAAFADGPKATKKFSRPSIHVVNAFLLAYQLGACCVYVVFIAANIQSVVNTYITPLGIEIYMLVFLIPLILINWIKHLKKLAPFSTAANAVTFVCFGIILYYILKEGPTFEHKEPVGKVENMPLFFGTVLFALEAVGVILPLENEMKTPRSFVKPVGVLNTGMTLIVVLYFGMGLLGYLAYGHTTEGSITLNITKTDILAQIVQISLSLSIFITHALQCYVAIDIIWNQYMLPKLEKNSKQIFWEYGLRTALVVLTFLVAVAVPALDLFISLIGAFCLAAVGIVMPAIIETLTYWHSYDGGRFCLLLAKNFSLIIFGILGLIAGTYISVRDLVKEFA